MLSGLLALTLAQLLGGGILQIFLKIALTEFPPILLSSARFLIATSLLFLFFSWKGKTKLFGKDTLILLKRSVFLQEISPFLQLEFNIQLLSWDK
ncbi:MAG TPA: hypothetical protein VN711_03255 [Candidatus Saccharimonadales bacterium]|nr:hypothetical protein [Candidatus Saccharimonadales bacterium]